MWILSNQSNQGSAFPPITRTPSYHFLALLALRTVHGIDALHPSHLSLLHLHFLITAQDTLHHTSRHWGVVLADRTKSCTELINNPGNRYQRSRDKAKSRICPTTRQVCNHYHQSSQFAIMKDGFELADDLLWMITSGIMAARTSLKDAAAVRADRVPRGG